MKINIKAIISDILSVRARIDLRKLAVLASVAYLVTPDLCDAEIFFRNVSLNELSGPNGFRIDGSNEDDMTGLSVSGGGDFNADGIPDVLIGSPGADAPEAFGAGAAFVIFGRDASTQGTITQTVSVSDLDGETGFRMNGVSPNDSTGRSVAAVGDINGDGIDDLLIGAPGANPNDDQFVESGSAYVVFGVNVSEAGPFPAELDLANLDGNDGFRINGEVGQGQAGSAVSSAGDVNSDGFTDIIIGAPWAWPNNSPNAGSSYVIFGRDTSLSGAFPSVFTLSDLNGSNGFRIDGEESSTSGGSVSVAGDVNGDGVDDLVIGAKRASPNSVQNAGSSYVIFGRDVSATGGFPEKIELANLIGTGFRIDGKLQSWTYSGAAVSGAGDINGDGIGDFAIGVPNVDRNGINDVGSLFIIYGKNVSIDPFPTALNLGDVDGSIGFRIDGVFQNNRLGGAIGFVEDMNGDGFSDVLVGADKSGVTRRSFVIFGRSVDISGGFPSFMTTDDLVDGTGFSIVAESHLDDAGTSLSGLGDFNNDGFNDLLVGAPSADSNTAPEAGSAFVVLGGITGPAEIPIAQLTPARLDFGDVESGGSAIRPVSLTNVGTGVLGLSELSVKGAHLSDFSIESNDCNAAQMSPSESCVFSVRFAPTEPGVRLARVRAESNAENGPTSVDLIGTSNVIFIDGFEQ